LIHSTSLSQTVDAFNAALFERRRSPPPNARRSRAGSRPGQGLPGAYAGNVRLALLRNVTRHVVFTGERITSASGAAHPGREACRALRLLSVRDRALSAALDSGLSTG
jgi:hypothetical protein